MGIIRGQVGEECWVRSLWVSEVIARILPFIIHKIGVYLRACIGIECFIFVRGFCWQYMVNNLKDICWYKEMRRNRGRKGHGDVNE